MAQEIVIRPKKDWWKIDLRESWQYRELLYVLAWRDIAVRYRQTILGVLWAILQPLITTGIFTIFFGKIAKIPSDNLPYPIFSFIGLTIWSFFSNGVSNASQSLLSNLGIISKVYFPRLVVPLASILTSSVDFLITVSLLLIVIFFYGFFPNFLLTLIFLPLILSILLLTMAGLGFFTSALNVRFRDVRYALPFFIQIGLYVTPIIYPLSIIYDYRRWFLILNPLTAVVETSRALVSGNSIDLTLFISAIPISLIIFFGGLFFFRQTESIIVDTN